MAGSHVALAKRLFQVSLPFDVGTCIARRQLPSTDRFHAVDLSPPEPQLVASQAASTRTLANVFTQSSQGTLCSEDAISSSVPHARGERLDDH